MIEVRAETRAAEEKGTPFQTWSIMGCTSDMLMTVHAGLEPQRASLIERISEAYAADGKSYRDIKSSLYSQRPESLFYRTAMTNGENTYDCTEDLLFLSEELRKCNEVMFRIKTTPGVF